MLQAIRDRATGWIAWGIIILITVPFAFWGVNSYLDESTKTAVATVNGVEIDARALDASYQERRDRLIRTWGAQFRPEMINEAHLRREALDGLIRQQVLSQAVHTSGFRVSDAALIKSIADIGLFQQEGQFNTQLYQAQLRNQGMAETQFEAQVREQMVNGQLASGINDSSFVTPSEVEDYARLQNETRNVQWAVLSATQLRPKITPTDAEIIQYYQQHKAEFAKPEQMQVSYLELSTAGLGAERQAEPAQLETLYQEMKERFGTPEQRHARHILLTLVKEATPEHIEQTRQQAEALRQQLEQGADFAEIAKQQSQDPGSAPQGGDLGWFGKGTMDAAFEHAVWELAPNGLSLPVRSAFGWHLIQLLEVRPEQTKPLAEVQDTVLAEWRRREGEKRLYELAEPLARLSYEHPDSLDAVAKALGVAVQTSEVFTREQGQGIAQYAKVRAAAFGPQVLQERLNSEPVELANDHLVVLHLHEHTPAQEQTLEQVRTQLIEKLQQTKALQQVETRGAALLQRLQQGETLAQIAATETLAVQTQAALKRQGQTEVTGELLQAVFQAAHPVAGKPSVGGLKLANGDYAWFSIAAVQAGSVSPSATDPTQPAEPLPDAFITAQRQRAEMNGLMENLRGRAEVSLQQP